MNGLSDISDDEFVPFLHNLGVETYKKSFEWMLNDRDFSGVLRWLFNNLDHNNALSAREEYRYTELVTKGLLLSPENLEPSIAGICEKYESICLPGDKERSEDVAMDISMLKERLHVLEKQEEMINDLLSQNEQTKEHLNVEITKLNSAHQQSLEDEQTLSNECLALAQEVESATEGVIDVIADTLQVYSSCHSDKENAKKFFTFGPMENYRQSQSLFRSHFDLYTCKKFAKRHNDITDEELRAALVEAKCLEERLSDALCAYIETKAELSGEQAFLALMANYRDVHPSQITSCMLEAQSAVELLEQEESILDQQLQNAVRELVDSRTTLALQTTANCALALRQQVHTDLAHLLEVSQSALLLDRVLYNALRHELLAIEQFLQFAVQLRQYAVGEAQAVCSRVTAMNEINSELSSIQLNQDSTDIFLQCLCLLLNVPYGTDEQSLVRASAQLYDDLRAVRQQATQEAGARETEIAHRKQATAPLLAAVMSGSTMRPNTTPVTLAIPQHALVQRLSEVDAATQRAGSYFTQVKNGDKQNLRKLWQWFLTDPSKLLAAFKTAKEYT